jgi:predicted acetyltransferase
MSASDGGGGTNVAVNLASEAERPLIEGLFQFYAYDFSEMEPAASAAFEFNAQGRFEAYPYLDEYWRTDSRWPLLIRANERVVGFALINTLSHRGGAIERNMAEFFVARKHRRRGIEVGRGVAAEAVRQILSSYPGQWEVAVAERNAAAKSFWPRAIATAPNVREFVRLDGDRKHWRGPIYSFRAAQDGW